MAVANPVRYTEFLLTFEDPGNPGTYLPYCTINGNKAIELTRDLIESRLPDCDDPDLPDQLDFAVDASRCTINGEGTIHRDNLDDLRLLFTSGTPRACQAVIYNQAGGLTIAGQFWLENMSANSERKQNATMTISGRIANFTITTNV